MIFPDNFEQKLGFDAIRQMLSNYCLTLPGRQKANSVGFSTDAETIYHQLALTSEMKAILEFEGGFPAQDYYDMVPLLLHLRIEGTHPETEQLSEFKLSLIAIARLLHFFETKKEAYPRLYQLGTDEGMAGAPLLQSVANRMDRIVDERSQIRDTASPALQKLRKEKASKLISVEKEVVRIFKLAQKNGWAPEDSDITIRGGRMVIPLMATHKRKVPGFLHDESATGQTAFIEPSGVFETNNEIRELGYAENREIIRILIALANVIRPDIDLLIHAYRYLAEVDFIRAKARFAIETGGIVPPGPPNPGSFFWRGAIHPLLFLSHKKQGKTIVPLDIGLDQNNRILIISGPNAGGKSVCLKTVGLVQYMFQCGLPVPVKEDSEFTLFSEIFIDIGDEQSIDNDLSTYTSKLLNLKFFIEHVTPASLFLIDELGSGTDPLPGGAIAEAALSALNARKAFGVVTTHYSNLKLLASHEAGIVNGAMLFDLKNLKPLFRLKTGKPGSSFALEIARQIGFPEEVLENAREKTGYSQLDFDRELQNLEVEKQEIVKKEHKVKIADDFLAELIKKYEKLTSDIEKNKKEILEKARAEARQLLDNSNRIIEHTIREIRETQAEKTTTKKLRDDLAKIKQELAPAAPPLPGIPEPLPTLPKTALSQSLSQPKSPYHRYLSDLQEKADRFSLTLDLRGFRADEALAALQRYIDDAMLLSIHEVRILHGKGNGVLRQVTRSYLQSLKEIKSARDAAPESGGAGITEVTLK